MPAITSVSYISSTTSTGSNDITLPSGILLGDILVIGAFASTFATNAGWTNGTITNSSGFKWKIADGTESGATLTFATGTPTSWRAICVQLRPDQQTDAVSQRSGGNVSTQTNTNPAQQTLNASAGTAPVVGLTMFHTAAGGVVNPRTTSITPTQELSVGTEHYLHVYIQNSSPADYTWDMDDEGTANNLTGNYLHSFVELPPVYPGTDWILPQEHMRRTMMDQDA